MAIGGLSKDKFQQKRISIQSNDEIGILANEFNKMADDLRSAMEKEKELTVEAEACAIEAKKRAKELAAANQQLAAKEQELRSKMLELERFNKFMVGRELKMVELKKEINSLLEQMKKPKKYEAPDKIYEENG